MPKYDLTFHPALMNAAGSLGFAPDAYGPVDLSNLGAFVTNPVSLRPRPPARGRRFLPFPGGFLIHTGYPNPGLEAVIRRHAGRWRRAPLPVLVHLLSDSAAELAQMVRRLERVEGVAGVEVGVPADMQAENSIALAQAASGELPVVVRLPLERAAGLAAAAAAELAETGIAAASLGPPRGAIPALGQTLAHGRLYGPALFPLALAAVEALARSGLPVIGAGGVYQPSQVEAMLAAGALAVQLDSVLWRFGF